MAPDLVSAALRSLRVVAAELSRPLTVEQIAEVVARGAMTAVAAAVAMIVLETEDGSELRRIVGAGRSGEARQRVAALLADAPDLITRAAHAREPTFLHWLPNVFPPPSPGQGASGVRAGGALAAVPVSYADRRLGVIVLCWLGEREFSEDDRALLSVFADHCALALAHTLGRRRPGLAGTWRVGDLEIDSAGHRVVIAGRPVHLTPSEFHILALLADEPGQCRTRREILRQLWHTEYVGDERACDAHLVNLRKKIERDPSHPERLVTVRGRGYALRVRVEAVSRAGV